MAETLNGLKDALSLQLLIFCVPKKQGQGLRIVQDF